MSESNSFAAWWDGGVAKPVSVGHDCAELAWKHQQDKMDGLLAALERALGVIEDNSELLGYACLPSWVRDSRAAVNKAKGV